MYRITFQNDNGWAIGHEDFRATEDSAFRVANTLSGALHPIGSCGRFTYRKLAESELGPREPELSRVQAPCLNPGDVIIKCDTFPWMEEGWRVIHCQTRNVNIVKGGRRSVRVYLERESDGAVGAQRVPSSEMVEVLR